uniref:Uncharacterized protein n=1 Tax=Arundo donax TaxID=35708 RepID=A0A0A9C1T4_ARUDO
MSSHQTIRFHNTNLPNITRETTSVRSTGKASVPQTNNTGLPLQERIHENTWIQRFKH